MIRFSGTAGSLSDDGRAVGSDGVTSGADLTAEARAAGGALAPVGAVIRLAMRTFSVLWPLTGLCLSLVWLSNVEESAVGIAVGMTVVGVGAGIGAALAYWSGHRRLSGGLYLLSAVTPTGFAYVGNLVALAAGVLLVVRPFPSSRIQCPR